MEPGERLSTMATKPRTCAFCANHVKEPQLFAGHATMCPYKQERFHADCMPCQRVRIRNRKLNEIKVEKNHVGDKEEIMTEDNNNDMDRGAKKIPKHGDLLKDLKVDFVHKPIVPEVEAKVVEVAVQIPDEKLALVIGKAGQNLKLLKAVSEAIINLNNDTKMMTILGAADQLDKAFDFLKRLGVNFVPKPPGLSIMAPSVDDMAHIKRENFPVPCLVPCNRGTSHPFLKPPQYAPFPTSSHFLQRVPGHCDSTAPVFGVSTTHQTRQETKSAAIEGGVGERENIDSMEKREGSLVRPRDGLLKRGREKSRERREGSSVKRSPDADWRRARRCRSNPGKRQRDNSREMRQDRRDDRYKKSESDLSKTLLHVGLHTSKPELWHQTKEIAVAAYRKEVLAYVGPCLEMYRFNPQLKIGDERELGAMTNYITNKIVMEEVNQYGKSGLSWIHFQLTDLTKASISNYITKKMDAYVMGSI